MGRTFRNRDHKFKQRFKENRKNRQNKRSVGNGDSEIRRETDESVRGEDRREEFQGDYDWQ